MGKFSRLGNDLYSGKKSIDFVGRKWLWYCGSGLIVLFAVLGLYFQGLNMGIEFEGGAQYRVTLPADQVTQDNADELREAVAATGIDGASSPVVTTTGENGIIVQTKQLNSADSQEVVDTILQTVGASPSDMSQDEIGASWGRDVAKRSITGLVVFLVLVVLFIWAYFREWKMSVAALVALAHDVIITTGVYALSGFEVSPATVTGILTILGFSLYDTVVVFDKVRENTKNLRSTAHDLRRGREPRRQPDPGAVDQHLDRGAAPGRRDPVRRCGRSSATARSRTSPSRCSSAWRPAPTRPSSSPRRCWCT